MPRQAPPAAPQRFCQEFVRLRSDPRPSSDHVNHEHARPPGEYQQRAADAATPQLFDAPCVVWATVRRRDRSRVAAGQRRPNGAANVMCARSGQLMMMKCRRWRDPWRRVRSLLARGSRESRMPYTFTLTATIPASPEEIYQAWLDSIGHSEMTGGEATTSDEVGAEVSAWDGYISGRNLELVPGERIVQSWRTSEFGDEEEDSVITVVLHGDRGRHAVDARAQQRAGRAQELRAGRLAVELFRADGRLFHRAQGRCRAQAKYRRAGGAQGSAEKRAQKASQNGDQTVSQSRAQKDRGQGSAAGERETIKTAGAAQSFIEQESCAEKEQSQSPRATTARTRAKSSARKSARGKRR